MSQKADTILRGTKYRNVTWYVVEYTLSLT